MNCGLHMVREQWHRDSGSAAWLAKAESLRAWLADAIYQVRVDDETLPLRGLTVVDLFAGGHGGFSMGLTSLGAIIELACEIDPEARSVFERNVRPRRMHGDICSLDGLRRTLP
jgi:predicted RNA methylase